MINQINTQEIKESINKIKAENSSKPWAKVHLLNLCTEYLSRTEWVRDVFKDTYNDDYEKELLKDITDIKKVFKNLGQ